MRLTPGFRRATWLAAAALAAAMPVPAFAQAKVAPCVAPAELTRLDHPLGRTARRLAAGDAITIVAIGSSSTAGAGASSPAMSYPSRLAVELTERFPRVAVTVVNRGVNGEVAADMVARFDQNVIAEKPDLVLWQVGSNSLLRDQPIAPAGTLIQEGVKRLKTAGADVVLMNPQYAPKVFAKPDVESMIDLMERLAKQSSVSVFQRYALMRYWRLTEGMPFEAFLSPDELHMNDWSYGCVAKLLAGAIADAATRPTLTAGAPGAITTVGR
jgi:lysophospholipase L1-like esterase